LNVDYGVLICTASSCQCAVKPTALAQHWKLKHKAPLALRKQLEQYGRACPLTYNHTTVPLPLDGSLPQPFIPVVAGLACRDCPYKSTSRDSLRQYANQVHGKQRLPDGGLCIVVQLQS
jgi:hypothetical protein